MLDSLAVFLLAAMAVIVGRWALEAAGTVLARGHRKLLAELGGTVAVAAFVLVLLCLALLSAGFIWQGWSGLGLRFAVLMSSSVGQQALFGALAGLVIIEGFRHLSHHQTEKGGAADHAVQTAKNTGAIALVAVLFVLCVLFSEPRTLRAVQSLNFGPAKLDFAQIAAAVRTQPLQVATGPSSEAGVNPPRLTVLLSLAGRGPSGGSGSPNPPLTPYSMIEADREALRILDGATQEEIANYAKAQQAFLASFGPLFTCVGEYLRISTDRRGLLLESAEISQGLAIVSRAIQWVEFAARRQAQFPGSGTDPDAVRALENRFGELVGNDLWRNVDRVVTSVSAHAAFVRGAAQLWPSPQGGVTRVASASFTPSAGEQGGCPENRGLATDGLLRPKGDPAPYAAIATANMMAALGDHVAALRTMLDWIKDWNEGGSGVRWPLLRAYVELAKLGRDLRPEAPASAAMLPALRAGLDGFFTHTAMRSHEDWRHKPGERRPACNDASNASVSPQMRDFFFGYSFLLFKFVDTLHDVRDLDESFGEEDLLRVRFLEEFDTQCLKAILRGSLDSGTLHLLNQFTVARAKVLYASRAERLGRITRARARELREEARLTAEETLNWFRRRRLALEPAVEARISYAIQHLNWHPNRSIALQAQALLDEVRTAD